MADIEQFLTKKAGPFPVWVYAAGGGLLASVLFLRKKGAAVSPGATDTSGTGPYSPSPIVITTPGTMPSDTSSMNPPTKQPSVPLAPGTGTVTIQGPYPTVALWANPNIDSKVTEVPSGTQLTSAGPPVTGLALNIAGRTSSAWQPVNFRGATVYVWLPDTTLLSGQGGGGSVMQYVPNSGGGKVLRKTGRHAHNQFVNIGMGGGGHAGLNAISKKTGVPKLRLMSINPAHWRPGVRPHRGIVHIG